MSPLLCGAFLVSVLVILPRNVRSLMTITLKLWAYFREYLPAQDRRNLETRLRVADGATVMDIVRQVGLPVDDCRLVTVNGVLYVDRADWAGITLINDDAVGILPNVH